MARTAALFTPRCPRVRSHTHTPTLYAPFLSPAEFVWCDGCSRPGGPPLAGKRFKCLQCPNTDLCAECFATGKAPEGHASEHEMLVFPTPAPQVLMSGKFEGLTCVFCNRAGFSGAAYTCATCAPTGASACWCESCEIHQKHDTAHARLKRIPPNKLAGSS